MRHGMLLFFAALNARADGFPGKTTARRTSRDFPQAVRRVVDTRDPFEENPIILDNLLAFRWNRRRCIDGRPERTMPFCRQCANPTRHAYHGQSTSAVVH